MVISASRIPCILSIPNLTLILLENPESRPSNKANPGSRETLKGRKENEEMLETRGGWGDTSIFSRVIASLSLTCHHYYLRAWITLDQKAAKCANVRPVNGFVVSFSSFCS